MNSGDWDRIESLFQQALDMPEGERESFLNRHCPASDPLRAEVDSLLEAEAPARSRLDGPPARLAADFLDRHSALLPGQRVSDYEIQSLIAMGGMGEVYLARDVRLHRSAVLKILRCHLTTNEMAVHRFETEARAASALQHPNIVTIYEFGRSPDGLFIAMEWVEGITWREMMRNRIISVPDAVNWVSQAAAAIAAAHNAGILHRDIKPENIMLSSNAVVKLLDFGLARLADPKRRVPAVTDASDAGSSGTISGTLSGTLLYMSPEILRGEAATEASDVFSLGAVLYELVARVHPFAGETPLDVLEAIECRKVQPPSSVREQIHGSLDALVLEALNRDPALRPRAAEIAERLNKFSATA